MPCKVTPEEFLKRCARVHGKKYDYRKAKYVGSLAKITIGCRAHGYFYQTPQKHWIGRGCPQCGIESYSSKKRHGIDRFIAAAQKCHLFFYDYSKSVYINCDCPVEIGCPLHGFFFQTPYKHVKEKQGCRKCGFKKATEKRRGTDCYKKGAIKRRLSVRDAERKHPDMVKGQKWSRDGKYKFICKKHGEYLQGYANHDKGARCRRCRDENTANIVRLTIEEAQRRCPDMVKGQVWRGSSVRYLFICKKHGEYSQAFGHHCQGARCQKCRESRGERAVACFLINAGIAYETQKKFDTCRNVLRLPFDFYIPSRGTLLEYQGEQHYTPMRFSGGEKTFLRIQKNDGIKSRWARANGYKLIRIKYDQSVEQVLSTQLLKRAA